MSSPVHFFTTTESTSSRTTNKKKEKKISTIMFAKAQAHGRIMS